MKVLYNLLKQYIDFDLNPIELKETFENLGIEVEEFYYLAEGLEGKVTTGIVEEIKDHPSTRDYKIVRVYTGQRTLQVVSGAPNLRKGIKVVVALPGAVIKGVRIGEKNIKGVTSEANILSLEELGLEEESPGILILDDDFKVGESPLEKLGLIDWVYDLYIFPNRPDLMGVLGLAYELRAVTGKEVRMPRVGIEEDESVGLYPVEILDKEGCPRYTARIIKGVRVKESPFWLRRTLFLLGQRPINNIVDVTNFVMLELGHPLHAFDLGKLKDKIIVRRADKGEKILCLDGVERELSDEILVIADAEKPVAIAGIIGGEDTGVTEETEDILIESAHFDRARIRKGVSILGIKTESSRRFERGSDPEIPPLASRRAAKLILEIAGGKSGLINDVKYITLKDKKITVYFDKFNRFVGEEIEPATVKNILENFGFLLRSDNEKLEVFVPPRRRDLEVWQDIAEEVLKVYGYDRVKGKISSGGSFTGKKFKSAASLIRDLATKSGFYEIKTVEFSNPLELEEFGFWKEEAVPLKNPLTQDASVLRMSLIPGILRFASLNLRRGQKFVRGFEVGKVFFWKGEDKLPEEKMHFAAIVAGRLEKKWYNMERDVDIYDLTGLIEILKNEFKLRIDVEERELKGLVNSGIIRIEGKDVGVIGEITPQVKKYYGIKIPCFVMEMDISSFSVPEKKYEKFSLYPSTRRDLSILLDKEKSYLEIKLTIDRILPDLVEKYEVIDVYSGKNIPENKKSITIAFYIRSKEKTLTQEEVDAEFSKIINAIKNAGFEIRGLE